MSIGQWKYTKIEDAPQRHREAARLRALGMPWKAIAPSVGLTEKTLRVLACHDPFKAHVEQLKSGSELLAANVKRNIEEIAELGTGQLKEMVEAGDLESNELIRATEMALDRHPSGEFVKQSRTKVDGSVNHLHQVTADALEDMKSRYRRQVVGEVVDNEELPEDGEIEWDEGDDGSDDGEG
jgi:deoxyribose-phosphate aldolase